MARISAGGLDASIPRSQFVSFAMEASAERFGHAMMAANIPGMLMEALVSLPATWPMSFTPAGMTLDVWRCFSIPLFCLPAWWLVGLGIDGILGWRRLHWSVMLIGTIFCVICIVLFLGLWLGVSAKEREGTVWPLYGVVLWAFLFGTLPCAWWRRRQQRSKGET